ncbi:hypothetical protein OAO55_00260 [Bacteroidales bacterium]|nr:hypothetical protein [Bacteroidales bacterium]
MDVYTLEISYIAKFTNTTKEFMVFNNGKSISAYKISRASVVILGVNIMIFMIIRGGGPGSGVVKENALLFSIISLIMVAFFVVQHLRNVFFFYFFDESDRFIIRYFGLLSKNRGKVQIEIPKYTLYDIEIFSERMGLQKYLVIRQRSRDGGIYRYAPISISAVNNNKLEEIKKILKDQIDKNNL